jgi:hypothetical protein
MLLSLYLIFKHENLVLPLHAFRTPPRIPTGQKTEMRGQGSGPTASLRAGGERRVREAREIIGAGRNRF